MKLSFPPDVFKALPKRKAAFISIIALPILLFFLAVTILFIKAPSSQYQTNSNAQSSSETITLNPSITYQTMTGWEATTKNWEDDKVNNKYDPTAYMYMDPILDTLVNKLGVNRLRLEIKSGAENPADYWNPFVNGTLGYTEMKNHRYEKINDNNDPNTADPKGFQWAELDWRIEKTVLPMKALLEARGEKLYINLCYIDFKGGLEGSLSHGKNPEEYAELITETFKHIKNKYSFTPDAFEITLEPENTTDWRGPEIGRGIIAAVNRLNANGFSPTVIAPSTTAAGNTVPYFDQMIAAVPAAKEHLKVLSYHRYDGPNTATLQAIKDRAQANGLQTAMSEFLNADINTLVEDLKLVNASFWQQWGIATKNADSGNYYLWADVVNPTSPVINLSSRSNLLQQYFKYIRLNAVRIDATSTNASTYDPVAFRNADGKYVVVVKNNSSAPFTVHGLPAGTYGITYSSPAQSNISLTNVSIQTGGTITANGGATGAVTIFALGGATPTTTIPTPSPYPTPTFACLGACPTLPVTPRPTASTPMPSSSSASPTAANPSTLPTPTNIQQSPIPTPSLPPDNKDIIGRILEFIKFILEMLLQLLGLGVEPHKANTPL